MATARDVPAIEGGAPVRPAVLPYGRQWVAEDDIAAVTQALRSDWLTTGPLVGQFEAAVAQATGARHAVAVSSGTAALHAAVFAIDVGPGDEVIVPPITFAATANVVLYQGGMPVFVDVDPQTLLLDPMRAVDAVSPRTKAILAVDYAGQPAEWDVLRAVADRYDIALIADACHALGAADNGRPVGTLADLSCFSLHPVKPVTTAEGGVTVTDNDDYAAAMRLFRNHGVSSDHRQREKAGAHYYEMQALGYNYRLSDLQCALGLSQIGKLPEFIARRQQIAARYDAAFATMPGVRPLSARPGVSHGYHLYVVMLELEALRVDRDQIFRALRAEGIGVNVHYVPVHRHPYYRTRYGYQGGEFPVAEWAYARMLSLPVFPKMSDADVDDVIVAMDKVIRYYTRATARPANERTDADADAAGVEDLSPLQYPGDPRDDHVRRGGRLQRLSAA